LRKPATIHGQSFGVAAVPVAPEIDKLVSGLGKVYTDKSPKISVSVFDKARFRGDAGDLLELAGNLLDNACKWCRSAVRLTIAPLDPDEPHSGSLRLVVEDDGPGIPENAREALLQRGMRLDEKAPGHGIGLAVVKELAASYNGDVRVSESTLGGARIEVTVDPGGQAQ
jgi:two-component system sensor histidine kinase PhoQ